jgi:hypothetical protein
LHTGELFKIRRRYPEKPAAAPRNACIQIMQKGAEKQELPAPLPDSGIRSSGGRENYCCPALISIDKSFFLKYNKVGSITMD